MTLEELEQKKILEGWKIEQDQNPISWKWYFVKGKYRVCYSYYDISNGRHSDIHDINCKFKAIEHYENDSELCKNLRNNFYHIDLSNISKVMFYLYNILMQEDLGQKRFDC